MLSSLCMELIKQMRKREFIEMGLKATAALLAAFLAIILMEGMIYGIELNALLTKGQSTFTDNGSTIAYCIEQDDGLYNVIYYNEGASREWSSHKSQVMTLERIQSTDFQRSVKEVVMHAPNAFEFSITPMHFVVMGVFVSAVIGFFVYKFISLNKEYIKIQTNFEKNGTIEIG